MAAQRIDDAQYLAGRDFFERGKTLRQVVEAMHSETLADSEKGELSFCLGFADAFLDRLRKV